MDWRESDERALKWEASASTFWVLAYERSADDPSAMPAVSAFRVSDASFDQVQSWARESGFGEVSIGIEMSTSQGLGVVWLVGGEYQ